DGIYIVPPGSSQDGITLSHFNCAPSPVLVMTISYFFPMPQQSCCYFPVLPHPGMGTGIVEARDCDGMVFYPDGLISTINGNVSCPCPAPPTVPAETTTWGAIKELYSD
ncbi:MAG: hypothetical protein ABIA59_04370, partial [Candidatus Latescibacterota bacterium]